MHGAACLALDQAFHALFHMDRRIPPTMASLGMQQQVGPHSQHLQHFKHNFGGVSLRPSTLMPDELQ